MKRLAGKGRNMSDLFDKYVRALDEFGRRVHEVRPDQWDNQTPCTEWDVRTLVNHIVGEQLWAPYLLAGRTMEEVGGRFDGDVLGDDPGSAWDNAAADARAAFGRAGALEGTVHLSYGDDEAETYARQMITDLTVHAWDLARGIEADDTLDRALVERVHDWTVPQADALASTGLFAPPVPTASDAPVQARTLAMFGRDPHE